MIIRACGAPARNFFCAAGSHVRARICAHAHTNTSTSTLVNAAQHASLSLGFRACSMPRRVTADVTMTARHVSTSTAYPHVCSASGSLSHTHAPIDAHMHLTRRLPCRSMTTGGAPGSSKPGDATGGASEGTSGSPVAADNPTGTGTGTHTQTDAQPGGGASGPGATTENHGAEQGEHGHAGAAPARVAEAAHAVGQAAAAVGDYVHRAELAAMRVISVEDIARFRGYVLMLAVAGGAVLFLTYPYLKSEFVTQTSDVAGQLLSAKDVQAKASIFAKAVINETLNDPALLTQAQAFLHSLLNSPATQAILQDLIARTLRSPETQAEVRRFTDGLVAWLLADPDTRARLVDLTLWLLAEPSTREATVDLTNRSLADPEFQAYGQKSVVALLHSTLDDPTVKEHATKWLWDMLADEALRKQGGDYLYSAYKYSVTPSFMMTSPKDAVKAAAKTAAAKVHRHRAASAPPAMVPPKLGEELAAAVTAVESTVAGAPPAEPVPALNGDHDDDELLDEEDESEASNEADTDEMAEPGAPPVAPANSGVQHANTPPSNSQSAPAPAPTPQPPATSAPSATTAEGANTTNHNVNDYSTHAATTAAPPMESAGDASTAAQRRKPAPERAAPASGRPIAPPASHTYVTHVEISVPRAPSKLGSSALEADGEVDRAIQEAQQRAEAALPAHERQQGSEAGAAAQSESVVVPPRPDPVARYADILAVHDTDKLHADTATARATWDAVVPNLRLAGPAAEAARASATPP